MASAIAPRQTTKSATTAARTPACVPMSDLERKTSNGSAQKMRFHYRINGKRTAIEVDAYPVTEHFALARTMNEGFGTPSFSRKWTVMHVPSSLGSALFVPRKADAAAFAARLEQQGRDFGIDWRKRSLRALKKSTTATKWGLLAEWARKERSKIERRPR